MCLLSPYASQTLSIPYAICQQQLFGNRRPVLASLNRCASLLGYYYEGDLLGHTGCVNGINFSNGAASMLVSGSDDTRVLLWDVFAIPHDGHELTKGKRYRKEFFGHRSNIFSVAFHGADNRYIITAANDLEVHRYDVEASNRPVSRYLRHRGPAFKASPHASDENLFLSCGDDGFVFLWDARAPGRPSGILSFQSSVNSVDFNPNPDLSHLILTGTVRKGVAVWDLRQCFSSSAFRTPQSLIRYDSPPTNSTASATACFSRDGTRIAVTYKRRLCVSYALFSPHPQYVCTAEGFRNACTMKSPAFGGLEEEFLLCGSDDHRIYGWRVPPREVHDSEAEPVILSDASFVLSAHRSIVNNIRSHPHVPLLASAGVEKCVKLWSLFRRENPYVVSRPRLANVRNLPVLSSEFLQLLHGSGPNNEEDEESNSIFESPRTLMLFDYFNRMEDEAEEAGDKSDENSDLAELYQSSNESEGDDMDEVNPYEEPGMSSYAREVLSDEESSSVESTAARRVTSPPDENNGEDSSEDIA